jgi:hypothetical protein
MNAARHDVPYRYVGEEELGHIHLDGEAHIPLGRALASVMIKARLARRFRWSREFVVVDTADHDRAVWIFGLRRVQIDGAEVDELASRVRDLRRSAPRHDPRPR